MQTLVWRSPKNCTSASSFNEWFTPHDSNQPGWGGQGLAGSLRFLSTVACCAPRLTPLCAAAQDCPNIQWLLLEETLLLQSLLQTIERKVWRSSPGRGSGVGPTGSGRDSRQTGLAPGLHMPCPPPLQLLENRQRGAAGGPALIEAPPSATVPAAARRRPVGPAGSGEMASGGLLLPRGVPGSGLADLPSPS